MEKNTHTKKPKSPHSGIPSRVWLAKSEPLSLQPERALYPWWQHRPCLLSEKQMRTFAVRRISVNHYCKYRVGNNNRTAMSISNISSWSCRPKPYILSYAFNPGPLGNKGISFPSQSGRFFGQWETGFCTWAKWPEWGVLISHFIVIHRTSVKTKTQNPTLSL